MDSDTSKSEHRSIVELAGAQWVGVQKTDEGPLILFRDPETESTLALLPEDLSVSAVLDQMKKSREVFKGLHATSK